MVLAVGGPSARVIEHVQRWFNAIIYSPANRPMFVLAIESHTVRGFDRAKLVGTLWLRLRPDWCSVHLVALKPDWQWTWKCA